MAAISVHLLSGTPWPGAPRAAVFAIECQKQQDGWFFDDVVVHVEENGIRRECGCSVKSFGIFGPQGAPSDLVKLLWTQWHATSPRGFQSGRDSLVLVTAQHDPDLREAWFGLTESARVIDPATYAARFADGTETSALRRDGFASLLKTDINSSPADAVRLLGRLFLVEYDFQHLGSQSEAQCIALCQQALTDATRARASELWQAVVAHVAPIRRKGGRISLPGLLAELAPRFPLKHHPYYAGDLASLDATSRARLQALPAKIGGVLGFERATLATAITDRALEHRSAVLIGGSGNGKTVLARNWALKNAGPVIWIRATDLAQTGGLQAAFSLSHDLGALLKNSGQPGCIVLDGLDKCFDEPAFDEAARVLAAANDPTAMDRWQVLLTCCPEDWDRVRHQLIRRSVVLAGGSVPITHFSPNELAEACQAVPALTGLAQRLHLWPILRWPKALDLVAVYGNTGAAARWASESDFAQWFWESIISRNDPASPRERVARKLGVQLGDRMSGAVSLEKFDAHELTVLAELAREGHLEIDRSRNTVRFSHDLLADWARSRELRVQGVAVAAFLSERLSSPLWHRAVRFHALAQLEQQSDAKAWLALFEQFRGNATTDELAQNCLLEAPIFALDQQAILERLWPLLESNEGALLVRFLRQFLRVGTTPDRFVLRLFKDRTPEEMLELATLHRVPWAPYWFGVLSFLGQHVPNVAALAPEEAAEVCLHWLPLCKVTSHGMDAAAALAIALARQAYSGSQRDRPRSHGEPSLKEWAYRALMAAAPVTPEPVADLVLKLSGRKAPLPGEGPPPDNFPIPRSLPHRGPLKPWPDGPVLRPSGAFTRAFMDGQFSSPLFHALPAIGADAMFGVLLNLPYTNDSIDFSGFHLDDHGFNRGSDLPRSVWWTHGPFVAFLNTNPGVALPAIIRLVNFATDRALELPAPLRPPIVVPVRVNDKINLWHGHTRSFMWHRGHVFGPKTVSCALLSLEKWFYLQLEAGRSIDDYLRTIIEQSRSIALAGVLVEIGKKSPDLFLGPLRPIVEALEFSWIEHQLRADQEAGFMGASFEFFGHERKWAYEWATMPHRDEPLNQLFLRLFLTDARWSTMIAELKPRWKERLSSTESPAPEFFASAVDQFDLANSKLETTDGKTRITYTPSIAPPPLTPEELAQQERTALLLLLPRECRRMLHAEIPSPEGTLAAWWELIPKIESQQIPADQQDYRSVADALLGIVAVAVVLHRTWLAADPAREHLAARLLIETGQKRRRSWATRDDTADYKWDNFAAWAMTSLWCEDPEDPVLRQGVAGLAMWERYNVVERVMIVAANHRAELGPAFDQLLAHALRCAPLKDRMLTDSEWQTKTFDHTAAIGELFEAFLTGKTAPMPASWKTIAIPKPPGHYRQSGGIDMMQLYAALTWTADLNLARDSAEMHQWIRMLQESLSCGIARLERLAKMVEAQGKDADLLEERDAFKGEKDLLERLGQIVARMAPGENHQQLWEPIFSLGAIGDQWIDAFLGAWFLDAGAHGNVKPAMAEQWVAMLKFASTSTAWTSANLGRRVGRDLWEELLGIRTLGWSYWDQAMIPIVAAARDYHEAWARQHATSYYDTNHYLIFLGHKGARATRVSGLLLYHQPAVMANSSYWSEDDIQNGFARVLQLALDENWAELTANPAAREAFLAVALKLASQQHPLGSELLTVAAQRFASLN